jgi:hypothetical protein
MRSVKKLPGMTVYAFAAVLSAKDAQAAIFQTFCTNSSTGVTVPANISTGTDSWQKSWNSPGLNNRMDWKFLINANQAAASASLFFSSVNMEQGFDFLNLTFGTKTTSVTGSHAPWTMTLSQSTAIGGMQSNPSILEVSTDRSVNSTGFVLQSFQVFSDCASLNGQAKPAASMFPDGQPMIGLLQGASDTIYYSTAADPQIPNRTLSGVSLEMWRDNDSADGIDFDLYAQCNSFPTPSNYYARSFNARVDEFLFLPKTACPGGTWFVAVNSFNGAGAFFLMQNYFRDNAVQLSACVDFAASSAQMTTLTALLETTQRGMIGLTEGQDTFPTIDLYSKGTCPAHPSIRFDASCSRSFTTDHAHICGDCFGNARCVLHELSHLLYGVSDEYTDTSPTTSDPKCGHTIMANDTTTWLNDWCWQHGVDHAYDYPITNSTPAMDPNSLSSWERTISFLAVPHATPFGYNFSDHPFYPYDVRGNPRTFFKIIKH